MTSRPRTRDLSRRCAPAGSGAASGLSALVFAASLVGCGHDRPGGGKGHGPADEADAPDTGAAAAEWVPLPTDCSPESAPDPARDPLWPVGSLFLQEDVLAEVLEVELSPDGQVAYLVGQGGLFVVDLSVPEAPALIGYDDAVEAQGRYYHLEAGGPDAVVYATHRDRGLWRIDARDPAALRTSPLRLEPGLSGMAAVGDSLFVGGLDGRVLRLEVDAEGRAVEAGSVAGLGNIWELVAWGDRIYVAGGAAGLSVLDSSAGGLSVLTTLPTAGAVMDLALSADGGALYAAEGGAGVEVFDLSDPDAPESRGALPILGSALGLGATAELLWVADLQGTVAFDLADPLLPTPIGTEGTDQWAMGLAAEGDRAVVAAWGWLEVQEAALGRSGPDLRLGADTLHLSPEGGSVEIAFANLGGAALSLRGVCPSSERLTVESTAETVPPGGEGHLRLTLSAGEPVSASVQLNTDDPDDPQREIAVVAEERGVGVALGEVAPDFELPDLDGELHQLSLQAGVPVVLVYFATW